MYESMLNSMAMIALEWELLLVALLAMITVGFLSWAVVSRKDPVESEISRRLGGLPGTQSNAPDSPNTILRTSGEGTLTSKLAVLGKPLQKQASYDRNQLALRLAQGGVRRDSAVPLFLSFKMFLLFAGAATGFTYGWTSHMGPEGLFFSTLFGMLLGFYVPDLWLKHRAARRSERIAHALPDSLDMLVVVVEAGLGLDGAIQRVADEMRVTYPELSEEWTIAAYETQMGIPRSEAMRRMADRTNVPEMRSLVAVLLQAERLGTGVAHTLRGHSETMRVRRRQRAEERAAKTTVKLLFPLVFLIFPTIFVVILGPAVISFLNIDW